MLMIGIDVLEVLVIVISGVLKREVGDLVLLA